MDSEVKIDFTTIKHECESKVITLKTEEKAYSVTSDYAEEDVTSTSNSVATTNEAEGFDVLVSNEDVKPNDTCIKNLLEKMDRLKVNFYELENSLFIRKEANKVEFCRKNLTSIIGLIEKVSNYKALSYFPTIMFKALECTCKTLCGIKDQLSQLNVKATNAIIKINGIIDYAHNLKRNIVRTLNEQEFKPEIEEDDCTVVCEIEYSNTVNDIKSEIIDIFSSDSESEVSNDKMMLKKKVVKLDRLKDIETTLPQTEASTYSLAHRDSSDTDDSIVDNNTDNSSQGSSDPSYHPSDSVTDDCLNFPVIDCSCEKSQKSKRHMPLKRRLMIDSDSDEAERAICFKQNIVSRKEKTPCQRQRVSASNKQLLAKLRKTLTDTSEESDNTAVKIKTPAVENKRKSPPVGNKNKTPPVRTSKRIKTPSQICSNSHCKVDNSIKDCSSGWDHVHQLPRNKSCEPCEQSDEWDYSDESESEITDLWQILDGELPKSQAISEIKREHKLALLGIRRILRSLVNC